MKNKQHEVFTNSQDYLTFKTPEQLRELVRNGDKAFAGLFICFLLVLCCAVALAVQVVILEKRLHP